MSRYIYRNSGKGSSLARQCTVCCAFGRARDQNPVSSNGSESLGQGLKIEMIVFSTAGIELFAALRAARLATHVLMDGQLRPAGAAKDCLLVPFVLRPKLYRVLGKRGVAVFAGVVKAATLHLDRNNIRRPMIMFAAGLRVEIDATHLRKNGEHCTV